MYLWKNPQYACSIGCHDWCNIGNHKEKSEVGQCSRACRDRGACNTLLEDLIALAEGPVSICPECIHLHAGKATTYITTCHGLQSARQLCEAMVTSHATSAHLALSAWHSHLLLDYAPMRPISDACTLKPKQRSQSHMVTQVRRLQICCARS